MLYATTATLMQRRGQQQPQQRRRRVASPSPSSLCGSSSPSPVHFRSVPRAALLQHSVAAIRLLNLLDALQSVLAVTSALLWMVQSYPPYSSHLDIVYLQFVITLLYIADLCLRLSLSGLAYVQTRWAVFDLVTILPILYYMYQLGWYGTRQSTEAGAGFVTWVVALTQLWSWLTLARFARVFKLLRLTQLRSTSFLLPNALARGVASLLLTVLMIIVLGGGLMFVVENGWTYGESATFQQWVSTHRRAATHSLTHSLTHSWSRVEWRSSEAYR